MLPLQPHSAGLLSFNKRTSTVCHSDCVSGSCDAVAVLVLTQLVLRLWSGSTAAVQQRTFIRGLVSPFGSSSTLLTVLMTLLLTGPMLASPLAAKLAPTQQWIATSTSKLSMSVAPPRSPSSLSIQPTAQGYASRRERK